MTITSSLTQGDGARAPTRVIEESKLHAFVAGHPEVVELGLALETSHANLGSSEIDLLCVELPSGRPVYVELKAGHTGRAVLSQLARYGLLIRKSSGGGGRLVLFAPSVDAAVEDSLSRNGVTVVTYNAHEMASTLATENEARAVLGGVREALSRPVRTRKTADYMADDLVIACFTREKLPIGPGGKEVYVGLRNQTFGVIAGTIKALARGPWFQTNAAEAVRLIDWILTYPMFARKSRTGSNLEIQSFCDFLEMQGPAGAKFQGADVVRAGINYEIRGPVRDFLSAHPDIPDPLIALGRQLVSKKAAISGYHVGPAEQLPTTTAIVLIQDLLGIHYDGELFVDRHGRYDAAMAARILEMMLLRAVATPTMSYIQPGVRLLHYEGSGVRGAHRIVSPASITFQLDLPSYREPEDVGGGCRVPHDYPLDVRS